MIMEIECENNGIDVCSGNEYLYAIIPVNVYPGKLLVFLDSFNDNVAMFRIHFAPLKFRCYFGTELT